MRRTTTWALIVWLTTTSIVPAQGVPGVGGAAGAAGAGGATGAAGVGGATGAAGAVGAGATAGAGGTGGMNLWSFLCPTADQLQKLRKKFCSCALGQTINAALVPMETYTGGLIHAGLCPPKEQANPADLAKPADSAEGAAARIKAKEAQCAAKAEAVRYLATVNCDYYPEAEKALIASLRTDECECVRLEAARALATGCCCTKATIAALVLTVNADTKDGGPPECSERVRAMALIALNKCVQCYREPAPRQPERPDSPPTPEKEKAKEKSQAAPSYFQQYYANLQAGPTLAEARAVLGNVPRSMALPLAMSTGQRSVTGILNAVNRTTGTAQPSPPARDPLARSAPIGGPAPVGGTAPVSRSVPVGQTVGQTSGATPRGMGAAASTPGAGPITPPAHVPPLAPPPTGQRSLSQLWQQAIRR